MTLPDTLDHPAAAGGAEPVYRLEHVTRRYRRKSGVVTPLSDVSLDIAAGEFVAIQGPTGGGKSTLLQLLGGLDRPDEGAVRFGALDLAKATDAQLVGVRAREIGIVFQGFNLIPTLTALENVQMGLVPLRLPSGERRARAQDALARVGLADRGDHRPGELSGGQQQRVAIARAIAKNPRVLLADEPTGNLDESMRDEILGVLEALGEAGLTLIVVTHDSAVAARAHRRLRLAKGQIVEIAG